MKQGIRRGLIAAMVGALVLAFAGMAGGAIKTKTFSSGEIDRVIPEIGTITHDFALTQKRFKRTKVKDVNLAVRIGHEYLADLDLSLTGPTGRTVDLSSDNGPAGPGSYGDGSESCGGTFTVFNDEAETLVSDGTSPFAGQFRPESRLSTLDGTKAKGAWRLTVTDDESPDGGVLHCAELEVKYKKKKKKRRN
jgi:subtilisin-like proprotein convertase family protein